MCFITRQGSLLSYYYYWTVWTWKFNLKKAGATHIEGCRKNECCWYGCLLEGCWQLFFLIAAVVIAGINVKGFYVYVCKVWEKSWHGSLWAFIVFLTFLCVHAGTCSRCLPGDDEGVSAGLWLVFTAEKCKNLNAKWRARSAIYIWAAFRKANRMPATPTFEQAGGKFNFVHPKLNRCL